MPPPRCLVARHNDATARSAGVVAVNHAIVARRHVFEALRYGIVNPSDGSVALNDESVPLAR